MFILVMVFVIGFIMHSLKDLGADVSNRYDRMKVAQIVYRAYDDKFFDDDEIEAFRQYGEYSGEDALAVVHTIQPITDHSVNVSDEALRDYEGLVNRVIHVADSSKKKLEFKKFVLETEQLVLANIWHDEKLDAHERELVEYLGEYLVMDRTDKLIEQLEAGNFEDSVDELNVMFEKLSNVSNVFKLGEMPLDVNGEGFYKVK